MASPEVLSIYELPFAGRSVIGVVCDDPKSDWFQQAANLMHEALDSQVESLERKDGQLDRAEDWCPDLFAALNSIDEEMTGHQWRLFTLASVTTGQNFKVQALGIGSNQKKLVRACNLAIALTVARNHFSQSRLAVASVGLRMLAASPIVWFRAGGKDVSQTASKLLQSLPPPPPPPPPQPRMLAIEPPALKPPSATIRAPSEELLPMPFSAESDDADSSSSEISPSFSPSIIGVAKDWLSSDSPVDCAKQRLIAFRHRHPHLSDNQHHAIADLLDGKVITESVALECCVLNDLLTVLGGDIWKGSNFGKHWISAWLKWGDPFADPGASTLLGQKEGKRKSNYKWFFGCEPPAGDQCDATAQIEVAVPPLELCHPTPADAKTNGEKCDRKSLEEHLSSKHDSLTICTLTSMDSIPLGTDLDPRNSYDNLWAADKVKDPHGKLLVQCNLGCRVIDAENVGHSYRQDVLGQQGYDFEGVRRAAEYFRNEGLEVIVVSRREKTKHRKFPDGTSLVVADCTDDVMVLKQAYSRNCPVVSKDGFADWKNDLRIDPKIRQWLHTCSALQVRFSWGAQGEFIPDFDLPRPSLRPSSCRHGVFGSARKCERCGAFEDSGKWDQWRGMKVWYCQACWRDWQHATRA